MSERNSKLESLLLAAADELEARNLWVVGLTFENGWTARLSYNKRNDKRKKGEGYRFD